MKLSNDHSLYNNEAKRCLLALPVVDIAFYIDICAVNFNQINRYDQFIWKLHCRVGKDSLIHGGASPVAKSFGDH